METQHEPEIFTSLMAIDLLAPFLPDPLLSSLYDFVTPSHLYTAVNFHKGADLIPDDVEDTSLTHFLLQKGGRLPPNAKTPLKNLARVVLLNTDKESGTIQLYFPPRGGREGRVDPCCLANAMRILYTTGLQTEASGSEDTLFKVISGTSELTPTRYYPSPDTILHFVSRSVALNPSARARFTPHLLERVKDRIGTSAWTLDLAMRTLALDNLGLLGEKGSLVEDEIELLLSLQEENSSWPKDALFKKGRSETYFGGNVISTIFAVAAIRAFLNNSNFSSSSTPEFRCL